MSLLLDLGNTRLKWACAQAGMPGQAHAQSWESIETEGLSPDWLSAARASRRILAASVAGTQREQRVSRALQAHGLGEPLWLRSPAQACGVRNAYPQPQRLGVDRFLAMVASRDAGLAPCVVTSVGTALTLDALDAEGRHLGGLIAPGPRLMQQSLHRATAGLPETGDAAWVDAADDTEDAIVSGCWSAALGLVGHFHARMLQRLGTHCRVVLCGGDAVPLAGRLAMPNEVRPDLVLHGLAVWDREHPGG